MYYYEESSEEYILNKTNNNIHFLKNWFNNTHYKIRFIKTIRDIIKHQTPKKKAFLKLKQLNIDNEHIQSWITKVFQ